MILLSVTDDAIVCV